MAQRFSRGETLFHSDDSRYRENQSEDPNKGTGGRRADPAIRPPGIEGEPNKPRIYPNGVVQKRWRYRFKPTVNGKKITQSKVYHRLDEVVEHARRWWQNRLGLFWDWIIANEFHHEPTTRKNNKPRRPRSKSRTPRRKHSVQVDITKEGA